MRLNVSGCLLVVSLSACAAGQTDKPSPFHPKSSPVRKAKTASGSSDRSKPAASPAVPDGPNVGTACYYMPKRDGTAMHPMSASAATFPLGSRVRVTNLSNKKSVVVTVTENAAIPDRIISVSSDAAGELGFLRLGSVQVRLDLVDKGSKPTC